MLIQYTDTSMPVFAGGMTPNEGRFAGWLQPYVPRLSRACHRAHDRASGEGMPEKYGCMLPVPGAGLKARTGIG